MWKFLKSSTGEVSMALSLSDLESGKGNFFLDKSSSVVYGRLLEDKERPSGHYGVCNGGLKAGRECPRMYGNFEALREAGFNVNLKDGDCRGRLA